MKAFIPFFTIAIIIGLVANTNAELVDNFDGTVTQIRDDGTRLMWLKDTNYADTSGYKPGGLFSDPYWYPENQTEVQDWIDHLNSLPSPTPGPPGYAGFNDWRLPASLNRDGSFCSGYDCSENEMGYMYYTELENVASYTGGGLTNAGPFENIDTDPYFGYWDTTGCFFLVPEDGMGLMLILLV